MQQIASREHTPVYCYDERTIRDRCRQAKAAFPDLPVKWLYAMKANDNPHLLEIFHSEGLGFDTVSYEEVLLGLHFVDRPREIFYTENNMTDEEMHSAIEAGVILNIGSFSRLESFCTHPQTRSCSIRINPELGDGHHSKVVTGNKDSKFGIRMDLLPECLKLAGDHGVKITGVHLHIGSGVRNPENFRHAMEILLDAASLFPDIETLNFGGGFPVAYRNDDPEFSMSDFTKIIGPLLRNDHENRRRKVTYLFEPGRWLVASSGVLLTRVNTVKDQGSRRFLGTDTGFNHLLRPALYDAYHHVENISRTGKKADTIYDIAGNICESGDILAVDRKLPETQIGDLLAFRDTGAYGMTMASHYNRRALPPEVLVTSDGQIRNIRPSRKAESVVEEHLHLCGYSKLTHNQNL